MPEYLRHPVTDWESWERDVKWRLHPATASRFTDLDMRMREAHSAAAKGLMITQRVIGGYMYLRSLIGPEALLYAFHDTPDLLHDCMQTWFALVDAVIARHQAYVVLDELFFAEDICFNHGPLISPDMIREFLFPYYTQLITNIRRRQLDMSRHLYIQIDTDGFADPVIPLYREAAWMPCRHSRWPPGAMWSPRERNILRWPYSAASISGFWLPAARPLIASWNGFCR